jgi:hypothetical protein
MPDHKLMLVDVTSEEEAHYVCALINSSITRAIVLGYAIGIQMSTHVVERVNLPKYDPQNNEHRKLARLCKQAHLIAGTDSESALESIEKDIDELASRIWDLTEAELDDIRLSLTELQWKPEGNG